MKAVDRVIVVGVLGLALAVSMFSKSHVTSTRPLSGGTQVESIGPWGHKFCNSDMGSLDGCVSTDLWRSEIAGEFPRRWARVMWSTVAIGAMFLVVAMFGKSSQRMRSTLAVISALVFAAATSAGWKFVDGVTAIQTSTYSEPPPVSRSMGHYLFVLATIAAAAVAVVVAITEARRARREARQVPAAHVERETD